MATLDGPERESESRDLAQIVAAVERLAQTVRKYDLSQLSLRIGDVRIAIETGGKSKTPAQYDDRPALVAATEHAMSNASAEGEFIFAPMIGTFYTAAAPGDPPFVQPGDPVEAGQVVAIIEAMKIMNEIATDRAGTIEEVLARNGQPVEYGQALFRLVPADEEPA